jgi:AcrR family transcriptional regulator
MPPDVKPRREFPRRQERARATRRRVLDAARALFIERGYVATTIDAIAERADVSPETVYATFGNKRTVLSELVDISIAGHADAPPVMDQAAVQALRDEPDQRARLRMLASLGRSILERRSAVDAVVTGAAASDPDIATLRDRGRNERFAGQRELLRLVVGEGRLRDGLDLETGAAILYAIGSPETYQSLTVDRGWSADRFERWYAETLERLLLDP